MNLHTFTDRNGEPYGFHYKLSNINYKLYFSAMYELLT